MAEQLQKPSMITMQGRVINVFQANPRTDRETGVITPGKHKIQVMGNMPMQSGENRFEMHDLTVHELEAFKPFVGKEVRFALGIMSSGDQTILYIPKGTTPQAV
jgi:hypothetical protein